jgi:hypothetical protein
MNIQTVAENLRNTIAGKELHLANTIKIRDEQDLTLEQEVANYVTIQFLQINIGELKRILQDVEQCAKQASDDSWITNPDRMGGGGWTAEELDPNRGWK